jgi:hypothetical protein
MRLSRDIPKLRQLLRNRSLIVIEQSSKPGATNDRSSSMLGGGIGDDQHIVEALVIALLMKMRTVLSQRTAQHPLPDRNDPR